MIDPATKNLLRSAALLFAAFALAFFLVSAGFDASEGLNHYELAQHLLRTGELGITGAHGPTFDPGPDGRMYDAHDFGNTLFMLPWVALGNGLTAVLGSHLPLDRQDRLTMFLVCLNGSLAVAAICGALFWILTYGLSVSVRAALSAAMALGFGTMLFQYSKVLFDGVSASAMLMLALGCAFSFARDRNQWWIFAAGVFLSLAFITRPTTGLFVPAIAGYLAGREWREQKTARAAVQVLILLGVPLAIALFWQGWYNHLRTGMFWFPPMLKTRWANTNTFRGGNFFAGFFGVLFSPGKSIFLYSPALLLALPGWKRFFARHRFEAWTVVAFFLPYFLMHCAWKKWTGDWGWGPRYFLLVLAPMFLPAGLWLADAAGKARRIAGLIIVWGVLVQCAAVWNDWQYRYTLQIWAGHSETDMVWRPQLAPWVDAIEHVGRDLGRMAGVRPWGVIPR